MLNDNKKILNLHELLIPDTFEENNIEKINNQENKYNCKQFFKDFFTFVIPLCCVILINLIFILIIKNIKNI